MTNAFSHIAIRLAQPHEQAAIQEILEEARRWLAARGISQQWPTPMPDAVLHQRIAQQQTYVALVDEYIIGTFNLSWSDPEIWGEQADDAGYVHALIVRRSAAGNHIGTYLLNAASRLIANTGRAYLRLDCWVGNPALVRYYAQLGFAPRGTQTWQATHERPAFALQRYERAVAPRFEETKEIRMEWYNEPAQWSRQNDTITMTAGAKTDFWRTTHYGFVRDNGHLYYEIAHGDFQCEVAIEGAYRAQYDQMGLMVRQNETTWLKCGIEYVDGVQHVSAVVTRDYSDWSVVPLPTNPPKLWLQLDRHGDALEIRYSVDRAAWTMLRLAYLPPNVPLQVGMMCAAPDSEGFQATFSDFILRPAL